ncbi:TPA: two-component system response regulator [Candidatus Sumerlaeota bacterium]|jgi:putative nucleotidyltransferase with HDIG domain|nr:two-component system response regulator [Candidatus Sumerlaeota bacterium]
MRSVLFVDDEPDILSGIRRMLRGMRNEWDMQFVAGGAQALEVLESHPVDVVVSDMRMPEMDGAQLLSVIKERWPMTVRIILSGHSDQEVTLRSVGIAHQYLAKPCDMENLVHVISRACALRNVLHDARLQSLVSGLSTIPSLPALYIQIVEVLKTANPSIQSIGQIVSQDIGMTTKIMQLVNSSFFGLPRRISTLDQAVALLGIDVIKALVFSIQVFSQFDPQLVREAHLENMWQHCFQVGSLARLIAMEAPTDSAAADEAYLAGIVHDVGKVVLGVNMQQQYVEALQQAEKEKVSHSDKEREIFGASHAEVGAYLLGLWGFPDAIVEAVAYHHNPSESHVQCFAPVIAVHVANALDHIHGGVPSLVPGNEIDKAFLLTLDGLQLAKWLEKCRDKIKECLAHERENIAGR